MKKFNKSGHLQGNTDLPRHASPFIRGTVAQSSDGYITELKNASTPWFRDLVIDTDAGQSNLVITDSNSASGGFSGHLPTIVAFINSSQSNVTASIYAGVLVLERNSSGVGKYIAIGAGVNYRNLGLDLGIPTFPHSQSKVFYNDIKAASTNSLTQSNPAGTSFIAYGEERASVNYNRALYSLASNTDSNYAMLTHGVGKLVTFKLELNSSGSNSRFIVDPATNTVKAINMSSSIADALSSLLANRVAVGALTKSSTQAEIRRLFQVTDPKGREFLYGVNELPVRVSGVVTGQASASNPIGPFSLDSQPALNMPDSTQIGDSGNVLSVDIPRSTGATSHNITDIHDSYTIECNSATFKNEASGELFVFPGDVVTISGSTSNNGRFLIENIVSPTVIEVKPYSYEDIEELDMDDTSGSISVSSGGQFLNDVTIYLTERLQLPLEHDVYVTMPMENAIGTLDIDGVAAVSNIDVPHHTYKNAIRSKTLEGAYTGEGSSAGYQINLTDRPIVINNKATVHSEGTVVRSLSAATVLQDNVLQISLTSSELFLESDVGNYVRLTVANPTGTISDSTVLNGEVAVIVTVLDSKRAVLARCSRNAQSLAANTSVTSFDIISEGATPILGGDIVRVYENDLPTSGSFSILESTTHQDGIAPTAVLTEASLVRIHNLGDTAGSGVYTCTTSNNVATIQNADGDYLNASYPGIQSDFNSPGLLLRIYNGPNSGWFYVYEVLAGTSTTVSVTNIDGSSVSLSNASGIDQYYSLYRIAEASNVRSVQSGTTKVTQKAVSAAANTDETVTALSVAWKGEGTGISVYSNYDMGTPISVTGTPAHDVYAGYSSLGTNIDLYAGPGVTGIQISASGFRGFDSSLNSADAENPITHGLGSFGIVIDSNTYNLDPEYTDLSFPYNVNGGGIFSYSRTFDPAGVFHLGTLLNLDEQEVSSSALIASSSFSNYYGNMGAALSVHGDIVMPAKRTGQARDKSRLLYTESTASVKSLRSSDAGPLDLSSISGDLGSVIGNRTIVARTIHDDTNIFTAGLQSKSSSAFATPHDCILSCSISRNNSPSASAEFGPYYGFSNAQDAVGSYVVFIQEYSGQGLDGFNAVTQAVPGGFVGVPFLTGDQTSRVACRIAFKVVACRVTNDSGNNIEVTYALSACGSSDLTGNIVASGSRVTTVWVRPRFEANVDLVGITRLGSASILSGKLFNTSGESSHRIPILTTREIDQSTGKSPRAYPDSDGLSDQTITNRGISRKTLPASESSIVNFTFDTGSGGQQFVRDITPFYYENQYYQHPGYSRNTDQNTARKDRYAAPFSANNITTYGDIASLAKGNIFIDSDLTADETNDNVFVTGGNSDYLGGEGKKLVIQNRTTTPNPSFFLSIKVGTNIYDLSAGFKVRFIAANTDTAPKRIRARLYSEGPTRYLMATVTKDTISTDVSVWLRQYAVYEFEFSQDMIMNAVQNEPSLRDFNGFFVTLEIDCTNGFFDYSGSIPQGQWETVGKAIRTDTNYSVTFTNANGDSSATSHQVGLYPDVWFILGLTAEYDKKQAFLSSGIDIEGVMQARNLRMLQPVTGYQVVGPSSVDLLQNSEYGSGMGHTWLYEDENILGGQSDTTYWDTSTVYGRTNYNTEGRDVGLLPMWYAFYPLANELNLTHLEFTNSNPYLDHPTEYQTPLEWDSNIYETFASNSGSRDAYRRRNPGNEFTVRVVNDDDITATTGSPNPYNTDSFIQDEYQIGMRSANDFYGASPISYFMAGIFKTNVSYSDSSHVLHTGITIESNRVAYTLPVLITKYYRPKFDKTSFFRKGVHSASIHAHNPYFDPMFYWLHCAQAVTFQKNPVEQTILGGNWGSVTPSPLTSEGGYYDAGSYRSNTGDTYVSLRDSAVNPDAFIPPGRTGFVVPIDPPHGSLLTDLDLHLSFRPMVSRETTGVRDSGDVHANWGVWYKLPSSSTFENPDSLKTGDYWLRASNWNSVQGYKVRVWRHSPFDEGTRFGETVTNSTDRTTSNLVKNIDGNATLLFERDVSLSITPNPLNGALGDASDYVRQGSSNISSGVDEGHSKPSIRFGEEDRFVVDRSAYSYFVTIEFYTGVRKVTTLGSSTGDALCYMVPGYDYLGMDKFNADHAPYMWTPAFPGNRPTAMSTIYGNDMATRWEGYWSPYPHNASIGGRTKWHASTVIRRGNLNERAARGAEEGGRYHTGSVNEFGPTPNLYESLEKPPAGRDRYPVNSSDSHIEYNALLSVSANNNVIDLLSQRGFIPDHTTWYPVIKFRGLRIAYQMDRPGHGGWGG